jgi:rhombotail lipoprotein
VDGDRLVLVQRKNETNSALDIAVYHTPSRNLLFRAMGKSRISGHATPVNLTEALRKDSNEGFREAAQMMIGNLQQQIELFKRNIK